MRSPAVCLLAVAALVATAFGQTLEKTIWLPDSNIGLWDASVVFHNPVTNRVYFTSYTNEWIQVYDANTGTKAWRIDTLALCPDLVHCYNEHELWALSDEEYIIVIDDRTDSMVATLPIPYASDIAYNATMHKVYLLDYDRGQVLVYDVVTRTPIDSILLHDYAEFLAWDSTYNRVYVLGWDWEYYPIVAIDCTEDSVAGVMRGPCYGDHLLVHPARNKLYCVGAEDSAYLAQLWVYNTQDLSIDTVITLPFQWWDPGYLTLNPVNDMLYAGYREIDWPFRSEGRRGFWPEDTVAVFDCSSDTLVGLVSLGEDVRPSAYRVNEQECKVYVALYDLDSVAVLCEPDSIDHWLSFPGPLTAVGWNPRSNEMYMCDDWGYIWVLNGATDSIVNEVDYEGRHVESMIWNTDLERLYIESWRGIGWLGAGDSLEHWFWYGRWPAYVSCAHSRALNRIYLAEEHAEYGRLHVYDCEADSMIRAVPVPGYYRLPGLVLDHIAKLYLPTGGGSCLVYDTERDSVLRAVTGFGIRLAYQPANGLVYGWGYDSLLNVIDPCADTLVASESGWDIRDLAVNGIDNEAYFFVADHPTDVFVVDGMSNEVELFTSLTSDVQGLIWVDSLNFLACICDDSTYLVDCRARLVVRSYPRHGYSSWCLDQTNAILYDGTPPHQVTAMHCGMDSAVVFDVAAYRFCWDETHGGMLGAENNAIHVFRYDPVGMQSQGKSKVRTREKLPTIVRGVLKLPRDMTGQNGDRPSEGGPVPALLDIAGRKIMDLQPGSNDIRHVAPGVYFIREDSRVPGSKSSRKVIVQH